MPDWVSTSLGIKDPNTSKALTAPQLSDKRKAGADCPSTPALRLWQLPLEFSGPQIPRMVLLLHVNSGNGNAVCGSHDRISVERHLRTEPEIPRW